MGQAALEIHVVHILYWEQLSQNFCFASLLGLNPQHFVLPLYGFIFLVLLFQSFSQIRQRAWTVEELGLGAVLRGIGPEDVVP